MRIGFRKLTDERHELAIVRDGGAREAVECETKSLLVHDFLHYAVELEAWRSKAMDSLRQFVEAMTERPSATLH